MTINSTKWEETTERFVVYLDIMGFKDKVARQPHEKVYDDLKDVFNRALKFINEDGEKGIVKGVQFSDSIIFFSRDNSEECYSGIVRASTFFMENAMSKSYPMKGACAYGKISINEDFQVFFGQPIIDAYLLHEEIHYYGIVAHHTFEEQVQKYGNANGAILHTHTPMKAGKIYHSNIVWFFAEREKESLRIPNILNNLYAEVSGKPRVYVDNTQYMYDEYLKSENTDK